LGSDRLSLAMLPWPQPVAVPPQVGLAQPLAATVQRPGVVRAQLPLPANGVLPVGRPVLSNTVVLQRPQVAGPPAPRAPQLLQTAGLPVPRSPVSGLPVTVLQQPTPQVPASGLPVTAPCLGNGFTTTQAPAPPQGQAADATSAGLPAPTPPGAAKAGVVLCFGDSLTRGIKETGESYPEFLKGLLQEAGYGQVVVNEGNTGDTCDQLLARLQRALNDAARCGRIEAVLVLGGTNDVLRGASAARDILSRLRQLHDAAGRSPYMPRVGVVTLPPTRSGSARDRLRIEVNQGLREACLQPAPRWTPKGRQFLIDLESVDASTLSPDGVHYTAAGYAEFARRVFEALAPLLAAQPRGPAAVERPPPAQANGAS